MKKILVIEDTLEYRIVVKHILSKKQFTVFEAADGTTGLDIARRELPDLLVCDIGLPDMTGFDVLDTLLKDASTAGIKTIFLTALEDEESMKRAMRLGATNFLSKPVTAPELLEAVEHVFSLDRPEEVTL